MTKTTSQSDPVNLTCLSKLMQNYQAEQPVSAAGALAAATDAEGNIVVFTVSTGGNVVCLRPDQGGGAGWSQTATGLQGSQSFLKQAPVDLRALTLDINIDMIARDNTLYVVGTHLQPFLKSTVERIIAKASAKTVIGHDDPAQKNIEDWTRDSDHYSFIQAKIPALYFGVEDFAQHHKATDTFETIDRVFYVKAVDTMVQAVLEFDANIDALPPR